MESRIRSIVIGIAEPTEPDPHLAPAIELAEWLGATLHVVHAYHLPDPSLYPYLEMGVISSQALQGIHDRVQASLEVTVRRVSGGERVVCRSMPVPAALAILTVASQVNADLIIVGGTRHGRLARAVVGTTAQRVLRGASVPVLVGRRPGHVPGRVLLTTDLSGLSARVHERGVELAVILARGVKPELSSVRPEMSAVMVIAYDIPRMAPLDPSRLKEAGEEQLAEFLANVRADGEPMTGKVRVGEPAREIIEEARQSNADLVVLGTHGRTGALRLLIGSVAESVLRSVDCDVLVIPSAAVSAPSTVQAAQYADA